MPTTLVSKYQMGILEMSVVRRQNLFIVMSNPNSFLSQKLCHYLNQPGPHIE